MCMCLYFTFFREPPYMSPYQLSKAVVYVFYAIHRPSRSEAPSQTQRDLCASSALSLYIIYTHRHCHTHTHTHTPKQVGTNDD
jgi:hypothetical protein